MARTRGNLHSTAQDAAQRSRKKKKFARGEDSGYSSAGHGSSGGKRALYHHNYCEKDVTGKVRIKCAECLDFGLCAECFSVGAEVGPHKSNHPYRVMDNMCTELTRMRIPYKKITRVYGKAHVTVVCNK
uniref:ZZ-type domain-containing protein n=2 Tax=Populus trichocarpa TaxID=3694 RepID=A0A3N7FRX5_POPTR